jgi:general secretion pathway protein D
VRARTALPLLAASAAVMLLGLGYAAAQDEPDEPTARPTPPQPRRPTKAAPRPGDTARRTQQQAREQEPESEGRPDLPDQFRTGIEYQSMSPRAMVTFNLENADLPDLVRLISNITGKRFILPGKVRSIQASVYAPTQVPVAAAYSAFLSILDVNGMTVVPAGRYLKIVETQGIESTPVPTGTGALPGEDRYVTHIERVGNVSAEDAATLLSRFKSQSGNVTAYAPTNMLIITDTGANIRRMMRIMRAIDVPRTGEQVWIEPIHYANAVELAQKLQEIFPTETVTSAPAGGGAAPAARGRQQAGARPAGGAEGPTTVGTSGGTGTLTRIIPEERSNSLIIMATERAYLRILELIRQLDVPLEGEGRIHVHYVQNSDAEDIASTLQDLVGGGTGAGAAGGAGGRRPPGQPGAAHGAGGGAAGGAVASLFEGEVRVTAHAPSNALVITSSLHDYAELRRVIDRLDAPRRQVFIEAVIMELSVSRSRKLGFSFHGGIPNSPSDGALSVLGFDAMRTASPTINQDVLTGMAVGVRGPIIPESQELIGMSIPGFGVMLNAIASSSDSNVLSTPHIIAMDNVEAEISVGSNVPLQTSGIMPGMGMPGMGMPGMGQMGQAGMGMMGMGMMGMMGGMGGMGMMGMRQDVGTIIRVTPHINEKNEIRLEIEQEISEVGPIEGQLGVRSIDRRTARTEVMVRDNQTVVIGGLMRDEIMQSETKIPILGDIPVLGVLFRRTETEKRKKNLLLFLTPYIIRDPSDLRAIFERKMRERQEFLDRYFVFGDADYTPPIDYTRTRGLIAEILAEVDLVAAEEALIEAARIAPPPEHRPRPPIGTAADLGAGANNDNYEGGTLIEPDEGGGGEPAPSGDE